MQHFISVCTVFWRAFVCVCSLMTCGHLLGLVSWVKCGTWLYRFLIFALFFYFYFGNSSQVTHRWHKRTNIWSDSKYNINSIVSDAKRQNNIITFSDIKVGLVSSWHTNITCSASKLSWHRCRSRVLTVFQSPCLLVSVSQRVEGTFFLLLVLMP